MIFLSYWQSEKGELEKKYENSPEKIIILDWERWLWYESSWYDVAHRNHLCKLQLDNLLIEIKKYDICFFVISELIDMTLNRRTPERKKLIQEFLTELAKLNVFYISLSEDNHYPLEESRTFNIPWFAYKRIYVSKNTMTDFDYRPKDFTFNMLLGSERKYRTQMFERFRHKSYVYSTYMGHHYHRNNSHTYLEDKNILNKLTSQVLPGKLNTMENVRIEEDDYVLSHVVPEMIYNNTHFDIVSESQHLREGTNFTTEKTGKPLGTGRFFIWFNSPHKVEYLRKFGFELQDYLCEYDNIIDNDKRLEAIFELIKEIGNNENYIKKIYTDTKDARIHNQEVYTQTRSTIYYDLDEWISNKVESI